MGFNRFQFRVLSVVILIILTALALSFTWQAENRLFTRIFFLVMLVMETILLFNIVSKTNRDLQQFLDSLEGDDLSLPAHRGKSDKLFHGLHQAFIRIHQKIMNLRFLKEREYELYQKVLNQTGSGLILIDNKGRISLSNPAARLLLGIDTLTSLEQLDQHMKGSKEFINNLNENTSTTWSYTSDGQTVELLILTTSISIEEEQFRLISMQDIKKQLSEKAFRSQKNIIRILSHEINNTLTPITTLTDALIRNAENTEYDPSKQKDLTEGLEIIKERSNTILDFVKNYREISQIPEPVPVWFNLKRLIRDMISLNSETFTGQNIRITQNYPPGSEHEIKGDKKLIAQIIQNILKNSAEALKGLDNGKIAIKIEKKKTGGLALIISDNGPGIPDAIKDKLFTPFFSTKEKGTGIGLTLSSELMNLHDGEIELRSPDSGGTEVILLFKSYIVRSFSEHMV